MKWEFTAGEAGTQSRKATRCSALRTKRGLTGRQVVERLTHVTTLRALKPDINAGDQFWLREARGRSILI